MHGPGMVKVKFFNYGLGCPDFKVFDVLIDGKYQSWEWVEEMAEKYNFKLVPVLYCGEYSLEEVKRISKGGSTIGGKHIREGVVVKPMVERTDPKIGRVILKFLSDEYLLKDYEETTDM